MRLVNILSISRVDVTHFNYISTYDYNDAIHNCPKN